MPSNLITTLSSPKEVINCLNQGGITLSTCNARFVRDTEFCLFRECLSTEFYNVLLADLQDYSAALDWNTTTNYIEGDVVKFQGVFYVATVNNINTIPTTTTAWDVAPKFTDVCYEILWCEFLCRFIALHTLRDNLPTLWIRLDGASITHFTGMTIKAVGDEAYDRYYQFIDTRIRTVWNNMVDFMHRNNATGQPCAGKFSDFVNRKACSSCDKIITACSCSSSCSQAFLVRNTYLIA